MMFITIIKAQRWAMQKLKKHKIDSSALDAEILLMSVLRCQKEKFYTHPEQKLTNLQLKTYKLFVTRRAKHEPIAYIIGHKEFYGLDFLVNKSVLIPRPETELIIEEVLKIISLNKEKGPPLNLPLSKGEKEGVAIIDVGTGSGCIPITIIKTLLMSSRGRRPWRSRTSTGLLRSTRNDNKINFFAADISRNALKLARLNARRHGVENQIKFLHGNLLQPLAHKIPLFPPLQKGDVKGIFLKTRNFLNSQFRNLIITANLPYLPTKEWMRTMPDVRLYEPRLALDGGPDGLKYYRQLFQQVKKLSHHLLLVTCYLLLEICPHQSKQIQTLARRYFPNCKTQIKKDLAGLNRLAIITLKHSH